MLAPVWVRAVAVARPLLSQPPDRLALGVAGLRIPAPESTARSGNASAVQDNADGFEYAASIYYHRALATGDPS